MKGFVAACAVALTALAFAPARAQQGELTIQVSPVTWQGNTAVVTAELRNLTPRPLNAVPVVCQFVAVGQVLGTARSIIPVLAAGQAVSLEMTADVGGQPIDAVRCVGDL